MSRLTVVVIVLLLACAATAQARPVTTQVDVTWNGLPPEVRGVETSLSANGRYIAFSSSANNIVPGDTQPELEERDVFVRDRATATTTRVSVASNGAQGDGESDQPFISPDGRFVAFSSYASNFAAGDRNGNSDVFIHDRRTTETTIVSLASNGKPANSYSSDPAISANGRWVAFVSLASNLAPVHKLFFRVYLRDRRTGTTKLISPVLGDATAPSITRDGRMVAYTRDFGRDGSSIRVYDRRTGRTTRADVSSSERRANGPSWSPSLSRTGRFVAFASDADNLVPGDRNDGTDIFVRDRVKGTTRRVSIRPDGTPIGHCPQSPDPDEEPAPICSDEPAISGSGRYVVFSTELRRFDHAADGGVFVRDRRSRRTTRISISPSGEPLRASLPAISDDGRAGTFAADFLYVRAPLR